MLKAMKTTREYRERLMKAGRAAVDELIKVAEEKIIKPVDGESPVLAADRLKNAAATKKLAITDAFDILKRIDEEEESLNSASGKPQSAVQGFAERRAK